MMRLGVCTLLAEVLPRWLRVLFRASHQEAHDVDLSAIGSLFFFFLPFILFYFFFAFRATPVAYGSSQAKGQIGAAAYATDTAM